MTYKTYNQYIDSDIEWIGAIPSSWKLLKSKFIFNRINNQSTTGNEELLSVSEYYGVKPKKETINEGDFLSRSESLVGYKKCSKNDLVMNIMLAWKKGLGVTNYEGIVSPAYEIFNINLQLAFPRYMNYLLRTDLYASEFKRHSYGVIDSRLRLYPDNFKEIECILPPIDEQQQIANYLDKQTTKIDVTIEKNKELIDLLEEKRVALINQVVTKGLNPNVPMRDSGVEWIGEIPEHWNFIAVDKFSSMITDFVANGSFASLRENVEYLDEENYAILVRLIDNSNNFNGPFVYINEDSYSFLSKTKLQEGDIILANIGATLGTIFKVPDLGKPMSLGPNVLLVRFDNNINGDYFLNLIDSNIGKCFIDSITTQTTQPKFNKTELRKLRILHPPLNEQEQINNEINRINNTINTPITKIKEQITLLEEYKNSLIHHVVTGKIDVREEVI